MQRGKNQNNTRKLTSLILNKNAKRGTYEAGVNVVESIVERQLLQRSEQLGVHELARIRLHELVQPQLTSLVDVCSENNKINICDRNFRTI